MKRRNRLYETSTPDISPEESLDAQVLRFFTKAERLSVGVESSREPIKNATAQESLRRKSLGFLMEASEDEEKDDEKDSDRSPLNLETFASEVARLIKNSTTLLDIKGTILEMGHNYIQNAHDDDTANEFLEIMDSQYSVSRHNKQEQNVGNHIAVGARSTTA